jgi:uncharacterized membrane protein YoaK (UPF0700 family)
VPIHYSRKLTGRKRSADANRQLGLVLAFVAGAANAGGFLAVSQYTSHMTGIVSAMADHLALGEFRAYLTGFGALLSFIGGAACSAILVNVGRQHRLHSEFAMPLVLEAVLLLCFGFLGERLSHIAGLFVPMTVMPARLQILLFLAFSFFLGGVLGALGFKHLGYVATVPLALILILLASVPAIDDMSHWLRRLNA